MMRFVSLRLEIEYINVPKAACTAIKTALMQVDGHSIADGDIWTVHSNQYCRSVPDDFRPSFAFTYVREPLDRLHSAWRSKLQTGYAKYLSGHCPLPRSTSFEEFALWVVSQDPVTCDVHWRPQSLLIANWECHYRRECDYVGRFESLGDTWGGVIRTKYPALPALQLLNTSKSEDRVQHATAATIERIRRFYCDDYRHFYPPARAPALP